MALRNAALAGPLAVDVLITILLICTVGYQMGRHDHGQATNYFSWESNNPRPHFVLLLSEPTWRTMTFDVIGDFRTRLSNARVHQRVVDVVIVGMRNQPNTCPLKWLLDKATQLPNGSALFAGHCSSDNEPSAVDDGNGFAKVKT
jgi:hypothetical protein